MTKSGSGRNSDPWLAEDMLGKELSKLALFFPSSTWLRLDVGAGEPWFDRQISNITILAMLSERVLLRVIQSMAVIQLLPSLTLPWTAEQCRGSIKYIRHLKLLSLNVSFSD